MAGLLVNPDTDPPTALLTDPAIMDAVTWYADLFLVHEVSPYYAESDTAGPMRNMNSESQAYINNGQAAMWVGGGFMMGRGQPGQETTSTTGVVPFPVTNASDASTPAAVSGLSISKGTTCLLYTSDAADE